MAEPQISSVHPIAVLGAGNMGSGIAQACAQVGFRVRLYDLEEPILHRARDRIAATLQGAVDRRKLSGAEREKILARIALSTDLTETVRETTLILEAVFEEEPVKQALFARLAPAAAAEAVIATNTSSLSVTRLQRDFPAPERFAGLHFFFPAAINRLVEVVGGERTSPATVRALEAFSYRLRKIPIRVQDRAGFAVNRFFVPFLNESTRLAEERIATLATIESVGRELLGTKLGPFELMNQTGVAIAYHSMRSLEASFGRAYAPTPSLQRQFEAGTPWTWNESSIEPERTEPVRDRFLGLILGIATQLVEEGVATPEATDRGAVVGLRWKRGPFAMLSDLGLTRGLELVEQYAQRWGPDFPVARTLRVRAASGEARWPLRWVRVEREDSLAWVLLDRPEVLNALNSELLAQIDQAFQSLEPDAELRAVILAGSSPVFAAGADIAEMAAKDVAAGRAFGFYGQSVCKRIEEFRTPVIALVEGYALGGGFELALSCDFIVAAAGAQLGLPEVTVGIHPGFGGASRLARLVGRAHTKYLVYTGRPVSAEEAYALGLVSRVVAPEAARDEARALAQTIAEHAPLGVQWVKGVINRGLDASLESALRLEGESAAHTFATADRTEGMRAFLERRKPKFEGR